MNIFKEIFIFFISKSSIKLPDKEYIYGTNSFGLPLYFSTCAICFEPFSVTTVSGQYLGFQLSGLSFDGLSIFSILLNFSICLVNMFAHLMGLPLKNKIKIYYISTVKKILSNYCIILILLEFLKKKYQYLYIINYL